jgi:hypothetical protein
MKRPKNGKKTEIRTKEKALVWRILVIKEINELLEDVLLASSDTAQQQYIN